ncbi:hypothetical protein ACTFIZ_006047 [Dictyostelium cf. discoideum]
MGSIQINNNTKFVASTIIYVDVGYIIKIPDTFLQDKFGKKYNRSSTMSPLLDKIYKGVPDKNSTEKIENTVYLSAALNRPLSLSTGKSNILIKEMNAIYNSPIIHNKIGIFWKFCWVSHGNCRANYENVKKFIRN